MIDQEKLEFKESHLKVQIENQKSNNQLQVVPTIWYKFQYALKILNILIVYWKFGYKKDKMFYFYNIYLILDYCYSKIKLKKIKNINIIF